MSPVASSTEVVETRHALQDKLRAAPERKASHLACVLDAFSRRCVGWAVSSCIDTDLALAALEMALLDRKPPGGLIHHSDQGVQYASARYVETLLAWAVVPSMSAKGNPYENAKAESFFKTLKAEEVKPFGALRRRGARPTGDRTFH